jgi:hypothetical protein
VLDRLSERLLDIEVIEADELQRILENKSAAAPEMRQR